jgi:hypothetical protein
MSRSFMLISALGWGLAGSVAGAEAPPAPSGLAFAFEKTRLDFKVAVDQETVEASFPFKNVSGKQVKVIEVHSNCGCVRAETDKKVYAPGESGVVEAVFRVGSFEGKIQKTVSLQTDLPGILLPPLVVGIDIPTVMEITPPLTEWVLGEPPVTREIAIDISYPEPVNLVKVGTSRANFQHELVTVEPGRKYKLLVTPQSTDAIQLAVLRIETDCPVQKHRTKMAFVGVVKERRHPVAPAADTTAAAAPATPGRP